MLSIKRVLVLKFNVTLISISGYIIISLRAQGHFSASNIHSPSCHFEPSSRQVTPGRDSVRVACVFRSFPSPNSHMNSNSKKIIDLNTQNGVYNINLNLHKTQVKLRYTGRDVKFYCTLWIAFWCAVRSFPLTSHLSGTAATVCLRPWHLRTMRRQRRCE